MLGSNSSGELLPPGLVCRAPKVPVLGLWDLGLIQTGIFLGGRFVSMVLGQMEHPWKIRSTQEGR